MRRHHYIAVIAIITVCFLSILGLSLVKTVTAEDSNNNLVLPPTAPIGITATSTGSGIKIQWQAAHNGTYAIKQYNIWRQQAEAADFSEIATADSNTTSYSDVDGVVGDHYKLTVEDDRDPANLSSGSEVIAAAEPILPTAKSDLPPKQLDTPQVTNLPQGVTIQDIIVPNVSAFANQINNSVIRPDDTNPTNTTGTPPPSTGPKNANQASPPVAEIKPSDTINSSQASVLIQAGEVRVAQLEGAISLSNTQVLQPILVRYSYEKEVLYQHYDQLPQSQKAKAKARCGQDIPSLETSILSLPEALQINVVVAMARCQLVLKHP